MLCPPGRGALCPACRTGTLVAVSSCCPVCTLTTALTMTTSHTYPRSCSHTYSKGRWLQVEATPARKHKGLLRIRWELLRALPFRVALRCLGVPHLIPTRPDVPGQKDRAHALSLLSQQPLGVEGCPGSIGGRDDQHPVPC